MNNQLKAGAVLSYIALFLNSVISIIYTPIMLNLLGQSEYGLYSLANSAAGYIGVLNFGLGNALIRYTAKYKTLKQEEKVSEIYGLFILIYGILGVLAFLAGIFLTSNSDVIFANSLSPEELKKLKILMGIITVNISIGIGLGIFSVIVLAHEKFVVQKIILIIISILSPLIMLPILLNGYKSISMAIITSLINLLSIYIYMFYCFKVLKIKIIFKKIEAKLLKEIIFFSGYIFINLVINKLYDSTDQVILGIYSGTVAISIYTVGTTFTGYFSGFSSAISNVFLTKVTGMVTNDVSKKEISDLFIRIGRIQYLVISFALSGFIVFGKEFIVLWIGENYQSSYLVGLLILIPMSVSLIQSMGGVILQAKNKQKFKTLVNAGVAFLNVFVSILLVHKFGPIGCALGTAISFMLGNVFIMNRYYWRKLEIEIPIFWKNIIMMSFPIFCSIIFGMTVNNSMFTQSWVFFLTKVFFFSVIYIFLMWFTSLNKYEKNLILGPVRMLEEKISTKKQVFRI